MKEKTTKSTFGLLYIAAYFLVLCFVAESEARANYGVIIPFIRFSPAWLLLLISGCGFIYAVFQKKIKADLILLLLFFRIYLCVIPMFYCEISSSYFPNLVTASFPFLIYFFFLNTDIDLRKAVKLFLIFGAAIAIECLWAYCIIVFENFATYRDLFYKNYFVIPVGATNNIAAVLLPLLITGDQLIEKKPVRYLYVILLTVAIFLCKSRAGLLLCIVYYVLRFFASGQDRRSLWKTVLLFLAPLILLAGLLLLWDSSLWQEIKLFFLGYSHGENYNAITSGRLDLFSEVFDAIWEHPLFGSGFTYERFGYMRTHNAFLQMLYENGIIGLLGFLVFLATAMKKIFAARKTSPFCHAFFVTVPFVFFNAMIEETLLSNFMILFCLFFLANIEKEKNFGGKNVQEQNFAGDRWNGFIRKYDR